MNCEEKLSHSWELFCSREAKEAIHIRKFDPELNRNIGKMVIPRVFDSLLGIKPKNPRIASLLSQETGSQDIGIGLTQFHSRIDKRVNLCSNRAQRASRAKEAIHIRKFDPELNRNIGKMVIPRVFDSLLGIKPKNPRIASLLSQETGSQDIGIGLTQFHSRIDKRVNLCSNRAQRASRAKEAIHIRKFDPELNRNIGKMVIPRVFDSLLGIKPKNPRIASLLSQETGSQDIGIGLTQFHSRIDKRVNLCSNRAQRARNFFSN